MPERAVNGALGAGMPISCRGYGSAIIQVSGLSGGDTIAVQGSVTGATFVTLSGLDLSANASVTSITADGVYSYPALEQLQFTKSGTASTPTVSLLLNG